MNAYFDTAIILKLYVQEATSPDAVRLANECPSPYLLTPWQEIEARTALRLNAFWKEITTAEMEASLEAFDEDILSGRWKTPEYQEATVWRFARDLSDRHAAKIGCRTLDLLHVAVALSLGVKTFVTFDERQRAVSGKDSASAKWLWFGCGRFAPWTGRPAVFVSSPRLRPLRKQSASAPLPRPGRTRNRDRVQTFSADSPGAVASPAYAPVHLRLRLNRPSIVWLAARRQGKTRRADREFHLDDARFAGKLAGN